MNRDDIRFISTAADWADARKADICFYRDEYEGWVARVSFSDARGPFSAEVNAVERRRMKSEKQPLETMDEYESRVGMLLSNACAAAHRRRQRLT